MRNMSLIFLALIIFSCGPGRRSDEQAFLDSLNNLSLDGPMVSEEFIVDIIQEMPSPLEISYIVRDVETQYDADILNSPYKSSSYKSNFTKAINLGVYGADLGYTNIYEENQDAILYLNSIKGLANDLSIGQFFDFSTIALLATNSDNLDSLLLITTQNFTTINSYLKDNQRSALSVLVLTGGWLETLHITCQMAEKIPDNEKLIQKIGEQKIILDKIMLMLYYYRQDTDIADFLNSLSELERTFEQIEIIYTYAKPTMEEVDGILINKDNSTATINITNEQVNAIKQQVKNVREKIIS